MPGTAYSFGPFRLEPAERRLLRDGSVVPLSGKAFDTLLLLLEGAGALQTQQSLIDRLWPDTFVEPNNLQYNVSLVRRALAGAPGVEIQTVRRQGYRLVAQVSRDQASTDASPPKPGAAPSAESAKTIPTQRTYFCRAADGTRLAYATLGEGPPIVKAANWLNHLELDWSGPLWRPWLELFARGRQLVRYDARGNGLSDWSPPSIAFDDFVADLGTVFDAAAVERAPVIGISQGAAVAAAYAAEHPDRVSALVLIGGCSRGWRVKGHAALREHFEALMVLMRRGWGGDNAAFRQIFTTAFFPAAPRELTEWFNNLQRQTASPDNAVKILSALGDVDVTHLLGRIRIPTLVLHSRGDAVIPMKDGIELASGISGARFVPLDSPNHLLLADEPAWARLDQEIAAFLAELDS